MPEENEEEQAPEADTVEREAAVSLPERDAMSLIGGPGTITPLPPDVAPGSGPADIVPEPPVAPIDPLAPPPGFNT
jgi:hypothetical protein